MLQKYNIVIRIENVDAPELYLFPLLPSPIKDNQP